MKKTLFICVLIITLIFISSCNKSFVKESNEDIPNVADSFFEPYDADFSDDSIENYRINKDAKVPLEVSVVKGLDRILNRVHANGRLSNVKYRLMISQLCYLKDLREIKVDGQKEYYCVYQDYDTGQKAYLMFCCMGRDTFGDDVWGCYDYLLLEKKEDGFWNVSGERYLNYINNVDLGY